MIHLKPTSRTADNAPPVIPRLRQIPHGFPAGGLVDAGTVAFETGHFDLTIGEARCFIFPVGAGMPISARRKLPIAARVSTPAHLMPMRSSVP